MAHKDNLTKARNRCRLKPGDPNRTWNSWQEEWRRYLRTKPNKGRFKHAYTSAGKQRGIEDWFAELWAMKDEMRKKGLYTKFWRLFGELQKRGLKYQEAAFEAYQCCLHPGRFYVELTSAEVLAREQDGAP